MFLDPEEQLLSRRMWEVCEQIITDTEIRKFGVLGLHMRDHIVKRIQWDQRHNSSTLAMHELLLVWRRSQGSTEEAFDNLCKALARLELNSLIAELKEIE